MSTRRGGEIEGLPHNTLSRPLQRTRLDGLRRVRKKLSFECAKTVPSAEVETADLETTLGICTCTNGDNVNNGRVIQLETQGEARDAN